MLKLQTDHPDVYDFFSSGYHVIRRNQNIIHSNILRKGLIYPNYGQICPLHIGKHVHFCFMPISIFWQPYFFLHF